MVQWSEGLVDARRVNPDNPADQMAADKFLDLLEGQVRVEKPKVPREQAIRSIFQASERRRSDPLPAANQAEPGNPRPAAKTA